MDIRGKIRKYGGENCVYITCIYPGEREDTKARQCQILRHQCYVKEVTHELESFSMSVYVSLQCTIEENRLNNFIIRTMYSILVFVSMSVLSVCMYMHHGHAALRGQKRACDPLELQLEAAVTQCVGASNQIWSSARAASALNH